jgi:murein DD-endopeptidase MepM/ murein hydrolase activator NlpD
MKIKYLLVLFAFFMEDNAYGQPGSYIWPVKAMPAYEDINDFYTTNNYVDHDPGTTFQDYACAMKTYDGHSGVDIDLWPFSWSMMANNQVAVIAAADGTVSFVDDNNNNEFNSISCNNPNPNTSNCAGPVPNSNWNNIIITHTNGVRTTYGHLRNNSALVSVGQLVKQGQIIAFVGSSGCSSHPHLHFQVDSLVTINGVQSRKLIDPYHISPNGCNSLNNTSYWINQKPYSEPNVLRVMTHYDVPSLIQNGPGGSGFCQTAELKKAKNSFNLNDQIVYGIALRDISQGNGVSLAVFDPNNALVFAIPLVCPGNYRKWYATVSTTIPNNYILGTYRVEATYNGKTAIHYFSIGCPANETVSVTLSGHKGVIVGDQLYSSSLIQPNARVRFQSGGFIKLTNGFKASSGSSFKAKIRDCNYSD